MAHQNTLPEVIREWSAIFMHRSMSDFKRFMEDTGLSFSQVNILMRVLHGNKIGVTEIGEQLGVTNAAASQAVDRLVTLGLVERKEDPGDRRAKILTLTADGHDLLERGLQARINWVEKLTDSFTPDQQEMIINALSLLTTSAKLSK
jgi:DNA-binding MarR family transcriptional regulator